MTREMTNDSLAIPVAAAEMPPKPKTPAMIAAMKKSKPNFCVKPATPSRNGPGGQFIGRSRSQTSRT